MMCLKEQMYQMKIILVMENQVLNFGMMIAILRCN